jgi:pseudaminic acid synthase
MKSEIHIAGRPIGPGHPAYIVAEISGNHHQKYEEAVALVHAAKKSGADAVKLQTYTPDTITMNSRKEWFMVAGKDNPDIWKGKSLYELYQTAYTPWEWQPKLKKVADEIGIALFSSPFDETAVAFLNHMEVPAFKVASYEVGHIPMLKEIARTGKPVIMSVGFASMEDIELAMDTLLKNGAKEIAILHCVTSYSDAPKPEDMHLSNIRDLRERFGVVTGFSDNNAGIEIPLMAVGAGASILEKHLTLDRKLGGPDEKFSLEPAELEHLIEKIRTTEASAAKTPPDSVAMGEPFYGPINDAERYNQRFRRSVFVTRDVVSGEEFTPENVRVIRPNFGLHPQFYGVVLGRKAAHAIEAGTPLSWELIVGGKPT